MTSTGGAATLVADSCGTLIRRRRPGDRRAAARTATATRRSIAIPSMSCWRPADVLRSVIEILSTAPVTTRSSIVGLGLGRPDLRPARSSRRAEQKAAVYVSPDAPNIASTNRHGVPAFGAPESCTGSLRHAAKRSAGGTACCAAFRNFAAGANDFARGRSTNGKQKAVCVLRYSTVQEFVAKAHEAEQAARRLNGNVVLKIYRAK